MVGTKTGKGVGTRSTNKMSRRLGMPSPVTVNRIQAAICESVASRELKDYAMWSSGVVEMVVTGMNVSEQTLNTEKRKSKGATYGNDSSLLKQHNGKRTELFPKAGDYNKLGSLGCGLKQSFDCGIPSHALGQSCNAHKEPLASDKVERLNCAKADTTCSQQVDKLVSLGQTARLMAWKEKVQLMDIFIPSKEEVAIEDEESIICVPHGGVTLVEKDGVPHPQEL
uniref:Uncharacterized protein n=1 Tax=Cannabis sativa TaxID=3483 RepID=A0A803Q2D7_CANSA